MSKPKAKWGDPESDFFWLDKDAERDTMKAQVMAKINLLLKPETISYDNYNVQFSIPWYSPQPMSLDNCEKYTYMVEYALKVKSSPPAKILIEGKVTERQKVCMQLPLLLATHVDVFLQKLSQKDKENIIEISDSEESNSEAEKRKKKKWGKGLNVSICINTVKCMTGRYNIETGKSDTEILTPRG